MINPPLILVSALFFLSFVSLLYTGAWLVTVMVLRARRIHLSHTAAKRLLCIALFGPPLLALGATVDGATLRHSHMGGGLEHHSVTCMRLFDLVSTVPVPGWERGDQAIAGGILNGFAWLLVVAGVFLLARLVLATIRLEVGLGLYLSAPTPALGAAIQAVHRNMKRLPVDRFFECAIPAAYSSVMGVFRPRCVLSSELVSGCTASELEAVVAHEGNHLCAGDCLTTLLIGTLNCLFFYLRPVRLLARRWRQEAEMASDEAAVAATQQPLALAAAILRASGFPVRTPSDLRLLPVVGPGFADESACSPATRVERLLTQAQNATGSAIEHSRFRSLVAWCVTSSLAAAGLLMLISGPAACAAHCTLEAIARFLP
ncbi:MAG: M48 family metalloprotease [Chloroflexi bacterium]|nr:M48 family metalloprotease [Chloroflexota bacterium]